MDSIIDISRFFNENLRVMWWLALFLGSWTVLAEFYRLVHFIYAKLIRKRKNLQERYGKGKWAFITGSSEGIGKAFAMSLAKQGFNLILSARTEKKLQQAQKQIRQLYPQVHVKYISIDFVKTCEKQQIESTWYKEIKDLDISIVVNNAGMDYLSKVDDLSLGELIRLIELDCFVVNSIQYLFLERWTKINSDQNKKERRLIINVSSLAAELPISYFTVYNAAKLYVDRLTTICALEYPQIDFISLRPSEVSTKMTGFKKDMFTIQPQKCVEPLIDDLGYQNISHGHFIHALQAWVYETVPFSLFTWLWETVFVKEFLEARKKQSSKS